MEGLPDDDLGRVNRNKLPISYWIKANIVYGIILFICWHIGSCVNPKPNP